MRVRKLAARRLGGALGLLLALSLVLFPIAPALAAPQMPHQFWGTVHIDNVLAPSGTIVSAQIGELEYSTTVDAEGRYGYILDVGGTGTFKVPADDPDEPGKDGGVVGDTVEFYITNLDLGLDGGKANESAEFEIWGTTLLPLTVGIDTTPPTVESTIPEADALDVPIYVVVSANFSEAIDEETLAFTLDTVSGTMSYDSGNKTASFTPDANLDHETSYTASVQASDLAGNAMAEAEVWSFTTGAPDLTPPTVASNTPADNATSVAIAAVVSATFSEEIQAGDNFTGIAISEAAGVTPTIDGTTVTIAHAAFVYEASYTVTIPAGAVKDLAGNPLAEDKVWSFTVMAEPEPEPGDGGGYPVGGGGGAGPAPTYTDTDLFGTEKSFRISADGKILATIEATSADGNLTMTIPKGTIALGKDGKRLAKLETAVDASPPDPPEDANIIGLAYDFGPAGATFDPPITVEYTYDPADVPEGVAEEDLVLAYYDEATDEWVELDCVVDTENDTITASVEHFTCFAIIGAVTPPEEEEVVVEEEEVVVEEEEEEVVVEEEEEVVVEEEEEVVPEVAPTNWPLIGGIIAVVVVVALLIYFFVVRRRAAA